MSQYTSIGDLDPARSGSIVCFPSSFTPDCLSALQDARHAGFGLLHCVLIGPSFNPSHFQVLFPPQVPADVWVTVPVVQENFVELLQLPA
jgi:hypothetical protein